MGQKLYFIPGYYLIQKLPFAYRSSSASLQLIIMQCYHSHNITSNHSHTIIRTLSDSRGARKNKDSSSPFINKFNNQEQEPNFIHEDFPIPQQPFDLSSPSTYKLFRSKNQFTLENRNQNHLRK